jgi:uncharacterized small protein (DUF1192 family)
MVPRKWQELHFGGEDSMDPEDLESQKVKPEPRKLDDLSLEDLNGYIGELEREVVRVREHIAVKEKARIGADAVFRQ